MTRLLVECTYVFEHPKVNSGIQRVVRNVIRELPEADETVECIPVAMLDGTLYQVHSLAPLDPRPHSPLVRLRILVERAANYFWLGQRTLEKRRPFRSSPWARRLLYVACRLFAFAFLSIPLRLLDRILGKQQPAPVRATPLEHRAGDQLVLLDSSWHADFFPLAERLKSEGVGIVSVIYDLIPLTHPQFCDAGLVKVFNHWFDWIAATADGYVAISETIRDEVRAEMLRRIGPEKVAQRWFDYFHLGSELDLVEDGASVEPDLLRMFKAKAPVFLMVSTIEPRKNHGYLLDAFERAWAQGSQARLCIAGRIGWKCEALVERVRQHPELNKRLFMFNDLSDKSLEYAYSHAASLVFPSYVEGFGLPLVEAMQRGLPRERFVVAPLGHAARFRPRDRESLREPLRAHGLVPRGYFLCVGTLEPRKNLSLALRAHGQLPAAVRQRFPLMIVGMPGWESRSLDDELRQALASGTVRLLGYLPDERVAELMSGARALVFPSIYEGFGLPVLEAMASGTPVLLTRLSAMPEVAGEAGSYIDPDDANGLSDMLVRMTEDTVYWECCREAGLRRAEQFSWKRCANLTAAAYRRAVEG